MKQWNIQKGDMNCILSITTDAKIKMSINNEVTFLCNYFKDGAVAFSQPKELTINKEKIKVEGLFLLDQYDEIKAYYDEIVLALEKKKQKEHDEEFLAIMSGNKKLEITYHDGEYLSGYTSFGVSAEVIVHLHCGHYVNGWGLYIDEEFINGNIDSMKNHFEAIEEERAVREKKKQRDINVYKEKKKALLKHVKWEVKENNIEDEGGKTKIFYHTLIINGIEYDFIERNIFDFGQTINPHYSVAAGKEPGGLIKIINEKYYWQDFSKNGWETIRELTPDELHAYMIVCKYGKYANAEIRI